jgi:hypothetical protein
MRSRVTVIGLGLLLGGIIFGYLTRSGQQDADARKVALTRDEADTQAVSLSATNAADARVEAGARAWLGSRMDRKELSAGEDGGKGNSGCDTQPFVSAGALRFLTARNARWLLRRVSRW